MQRLQRLAELNRISSKTSAQVAEFRSLMDEQMAWAKSNPSEAMELDMTFRRMQMTPEEVAAEQESLRPATPSGRLTPAQEEARTAAGQAARAEAIRSGKSPAQADAIALDVYTKWRPPSEPSAPAPAGDSFERHYTAQGEALEEDYRDFARYMRGLADKGELVGADGKPLPMYSAERIDSMTIPELRRFTEQNPRYANMFFVRPSAEVAASLEGTGRTGVGARSGMVQVPDVPTAPASAPRPATPTPEPELSRGYGDKTREFEEVMDATRGEGMVTGDPAPAPTPAEPPKKKKFGEMAGELYNKYGVPLLEIVEAVGKQRGKIDTPTHLDKKYAEKLAQQERDYAKRLEEDRAAREEAALSKRLAEQRAWEQQQEASRQAFESGQSATGYTQQEKLLRMQLEAQRAAARTGGTTASIIPD